MQRLFSTFANGWPGTGLLLQRSITAIVLFHSLAAHMEKTAPLASFVPDLIAFVAGLLLLIGLCTPLAGAMLTIAELWTAISQSGDPTIPTILAMLGLTLAMIGPGAWSIDARLFGRKQIRISSP